MPTAAKKKTPAKTAPAPAVEAAKPVAARKSPAAKAPALGKATAKKTSKTPAPAPAEPRKDAEAVKPKQRLVRDSFTIPKAEYAQIDELKRRAAKLGQTTKKSELLRAGIKALALLDDAALLAALQAVPTLKTGRPKRK